MLKNIWPELSRWQRAKIIIKAYWYAIPGMLKYVIVSIFGVKAHWL